MASGASKQRLVILDRDGVINEDSSKFVKSADEWIPIAGSIEAIAALSQGGFTVAVASNQSGIARGLFDIQALDEMHRKLSELVVAAGGRVDCVAVCPHGPDDDCECRKPRPGLLLQIGERTLLLVSKASRSLVTHYAIFRPPLPLARSPFLFAPAMAVELKLSYRRSSSQFQYSTILLLLPTAC